MQKRKFDELISYFNRKVSDMSIDQKYKMELLGMISAIGFAHEKELSTNLASLGTDCISRHVYEQCAWERNIAIEQLTELGYGLGEKIRTEKDCISRQAAIEALGELATFTEDWSCHTWMYTDDVYNAIKQLPPIQPKRGRWHYSDGKPARIGLSFGVICDQCGTESEYCTNFCGECGADMRGEQDG